MFSYILEKLEKKKKEGRTEKTVGRKKEYRLFLEGRGWLGYFSFHFSGIAGGNVDNFFNPISF